MTDILLAALAAAVVFAALAEFHSAKRIDRLERRLEKLEEDPTGYVLRRTGAPRTGGL